MGILSHHSALQARNFREISLIDSTVRQNARPPHPHPIPSLSLTHDRDDQRSHRVSLRREQEVGERVESLEQHYTEFCLAGVRQ